MGLLGWRWLAGCAPNQFVTAPFVPRRRGKKEGIFAPPAAAPAIHMGKKFCRKWLDRARFWAGNTPLPELVYAPALCGVGSILWAHRIARIVFRKAKIRK